MSAHMLDLILTSFAAIVGLIMAFTLIGPWIDNIKTDRWKAKRKKEWLRQIQEEMRRYEEKQRVLEDMYNHR